MSVSTSVTDATSASRRGLYTTFHQKQIGKTIRPRNVREGSKAAVGVVKGISQRYCAACQRNSVCYRVEWNNGKKTFPCAKGVETNGDELILL